MRVNWSSIIVTEISGIAISMPDIAHVSIFTDNDNPYYRRSLLDKINC